MKAILLRAMMVLMLAVPCLMRAQDQVIESKDGTRIMAKVTEMKASGVKITKGSQEFVVPWEKLSAATIEHLKSGAILEHEDKFTSAKTVLSRPHIYEVGNSERACSYAVSTASATDAARGDLMWLFYQEKEWLQLMGSPTLAFIIDGQQSGEMPCDLLTNTPCLKFDTGVGLGFPTRVEFLESIAKAKVVEIRAGRMEWRMTEQEKFSMGVLAERIRKLKTEKELDKVKQLAPILTGKPET